jgi:hypothetical protein
MDTSEVSRAHVVSLLSGAGMGQAADEAARSLPEVLERYRVEEYLQKLGVTLDELINRRGGSP